jgi:hypothetical protein
MAGPNLWFVCLNLLHNPDRNAERNATAIALDPGPLCCIGSRPTALDADFFDNIDPDLPKAGESAG